jgi:hypothetical protein
LFASTTISVVSSDATVIASSTVTGSTTKQSTAADAATCASGATDCYGLGYYTASVAGATTATSGKTATLTYRTLLSGTTYISATAVTVTIGGAVATETVAFDKTTYGPGEKATVLVTVLDADGNALPASTVTAAFAAAPTSNVAFSSGSDTLLADATLQAATSSTSKTTAGSHQYTVYMPAASGVVTLTATGSTGLAAAGRVAVTASAEVVNSSVDAATDAANEATDAANAATDAALAAADAADAATAAAEDASAAVATLAASVNTALGNLKKQITALTALVNKLLKK